MMVVKDKVDGEESASMKPILDEQGSEQSDAATGKQVVNAVEGDAGDRGEESSSSSANSTIEEHSGRQVDTASGKQVVDAAEGDADDTKIEAIVDMKDKHPPTPPRPPPVELKASPNEVKAFITSKTLGDKGNPCSSTAIPPATTLCLCN